MARDDLVKLTGTVQKEYKGGIFEVQLDTPTILPNGKALHTMKCKMSGRMRHHKIQVLPGDRIEIGLSTDHDANNPTGFIVHRGDRK